MEIDMAEDQEQAEFLEFLTKDGASGGGGCPSVYLRQDGMAVVQAPEADISTFARLRNPLPGERAVYIEPDVIIRAGRMLEERRHSAG